VIALFASCRSRLGRSRCWGHEAYIYGYPLWYGLGEIAKLPAGEATLVGDAVTVERPRASPEAERPVGEVRVAQQRHAVPDRSAGPERGASRARHPRPLLRVAADADVEFVEVLDRLGVTAAESPFVAPDPELAALVEGAQRRQA